MRPKQWEPQEEIAEEVKPGLGTTTSHWVEVRVRPGAKNFRLSISSAGKPALSVPLRAKVDDAQAFLNKQSNWLQTRLKNRPAATPFEEGAQFPLRGKIHQIKATGKTRGLVEILQQMEGEMLEIPSLLVPGKENHMARRLRDWLKKQALLDLTNASQIHAERLGVIPASIKVRGQLSRWGSCTSSGRLNYNWRLIMAPPFVLDYVAAHEVAHLCEMNHSKAFWAKVAETLPDMERGRAWLKANGNQLMAYGTEAI